MTDTFKKGDRESVSLKIARISKRLYAMGWEVSPDPTVRLRIYQHMLRLRRQEEVYVTPILDTPLQCWQRAGEDLLGRRER